MRDIYYKPLLIIKSFPMSDSNIILTPVEPQFLNFVTSKARLIAETKEQIKEQEAIARAADAAVARLEGQLDKLLA